MNLFLKLILKITLITLLCLVVLDFGYTYFYLQSNHRAKIDYLFNSKARDYDLIILGSSRANNHFVAHMFEDRGIKTFNYGMSGAHLFEASLMLKLMMERKYKIQNVIVEADLNLSNDKPAEGIAAKFLPYIHNSEIIKHQFTGEPDFNALYYIPFYRYIAFDSRIGFREMFFNAINKKTSHLENLGYHPLYTTNEGNMKNDLSNLNPKRNKYYEEIKKICKANKIRLIAVMTPICSNTKGMDYFKKVNRLYPEIHNYENAVEGDQYFSSCGHMNDRGARKFTITIIRDFFSKQ